MSGGWQILLLQGDYDLRNRRWLQEPKCKAHSGLITDNQQAWVIAAHMATDLGAVDIISGQAN